MTGLNRSTVRLSGNGVKGHKDEHEAKPMLMSNKGREARLHYMAGTFRILTPGDHVRCAVTGQPIQLDELRYWSVKRQEAYSSAELSVKAEERG